jgi:hypothetical protein
MAIAATRLRSTTKDIRKADTATMPQPFDGFSWVATPNSSMFTRIGYNAVTEKLRVVYRNSGRQYEYPDFNAMRWFNFFKAKSFGKYARKYIFNEIKGYEVR